MNSERRELFEGYGTLHTIASVIVNKRPSPLISPVKVEVLRCRTKLKLKVERFRQALEPTCDRLSLFRIKFLVRDASVVLCVQELSDVSLQKYGDNAPRTSRDWDPSTA